MKISKQPTTISNSGMIRSSKVATAFANRRKQNEVRDFLQEYQTVVSQFVDLFWAMDKVPRLISKSNSATIKTWLSARAIQAAGKQASGIVRGTRQKQKQRLWMINKLTQEKKLKQAAKLQKIYDETKVSKPKIENVEAELDSRFIKVDLNNSTSFDGWLTFSPGNKTKIKIPFKKTKHLNKLLKKGKLKTSIRLSKKFLTFIFDLPDPTPKTQGKTIGIDVGQKTVLTSSHGFASQTNSHGHNLETITHLLSRKKKGSKAFKRTQAHRKNFINWTINQLNLSKVKQVNIEDIKYLRKGKRVNRSLSHWTYPMILAKLEDYCQQQGVLVLKVNPTYTSQRCSNCGWTRKANRKGKLFSCDQCGLSVDADLNAALNLSLPLPAISKEQRLKQENRTGFYWKVLGREFIVPDVQEKRLG